MKPKSFTLFCPTNLQPNENDIQEYERVTIPQQGEDLSFWNLSLSLFFFITMFQPFMLFIERLNLGVSKTTHLDL